MGRPMAARTRAATMIAPTTTIVAQRNILATGRTNSTVVADVTSALLVASTTMIHRNSELHGTVCHWEASAMRGPGQIR